MRLEITLSPFDTTLKDLGTAAAVADEAGVSGLWVMDHLSAAVHPERSTVMEAVTCLTQLAVSTERCRIGPLVLNPVWRHPVVLAQSLAGIAELSAGRLVVGIGAGGGGGEYGKELRDSGFEDDSAQVRRQRVRETTGVLHHIWGGETGPWTSDHYHFDGSDGFLVPDPVPPMILAGYGPKMATLAGEVGDGFNTAASRDDLADLVALATRTAARRSVAFETSAFAIYEPAWLDADSSQRRRVEEAGIECLMLVLSAPYDHGLIQEIASASDATL